jgi:hypothetical protein
MDHLFNQFDRYCRALARELRDSNVRKRTELENDFSEQLRKYITALNHQTLNDLQKLSISQEVSSPPADNHFSILREKTLDKDETSLPPSMQAEIARTSMSKKIDTAIIEILNQNKPNELHLNDIWVKLHKTFQIKISKSALSGKIYRLKNKGNLLQSRNSRGFYRATDSNLVLVQHS